MVLFYCYVIFHPSLGTVLNKAFYFESSGLPLATVCSSLSFVISPSVSPLSLSFELELYLVLDNT